MNKDTNIQEKIQGRRQRGTSSDLPVTMTMKILSRWHSLYSKRERENREPPQCKAWFAMCIRMGDMHMSAGSLLELRTHSGRAGKEEQ